jgi:predicted TIM-barrel fold metal-dependent hydrolase
MRAVSADNPSIPQLRNLFIKFSGCLTNVQHSNTVAPTANSVANTIIKKDYIYIEFLKVTEEASLLGMF